MFPKPLTAWLLNPGEPTGGPAAPPPAEPPPPPPVVPPPPPAPTAVTVDAQRYEAMRLAEERLGKIMQETADRIEAERRKTVEAEAAQGKIREAFDAERAKWAKDLEDTRAAAARIEAERLADRKEAALGSLLIGAEWASESAARDARELLDARFEAARDPATGLVVVKDRRTGKPADAAVREWLTSDAAAHYLRPTAKGGAGARGGDVPPPPPSDKPKTWAEMAIAAERQRRETATAGYGLTYVPPARPGG
jgi:hypothetical protein